MKMPLGEQVGALVLCLPVGDKRREDIRKLALEISGLESNYDRLLAEYFLLKQPDTTCTCGHPGKDHHHPNSPFCKECFCVVFKPERL